MIEGVEMIRGLADGPKIGVMAITHGDEPAGMAALTFLARHFAETPLPRGELWLIQGNIAAQRLGLRCVTHDMNRIFLEEGDPGLAAIDPRSADAQRAQVLKPVLASLDYLLDLHNTTRPSSPFSLCMAETPMHATLAAGMPVDFYAAGFQGHIRGTTADWVDAHGGIGIAVECGYQHDPHVDAIATTCAKSFLGHLGIGAFAKDVTRVSRRLSIIAHECIADRATFAYAREFVNFDGIAAGELIATDVQREYRAPMEERLAIVFPVSIKSAREGSNKDAYFLGIFHDV